jgi:hypothetical protein
MPPKLDLHRVADLLLGILVVLALCVLGSTFIASCAYRQPAEPHWSQRDVPSKEDIGK